MNIRQIEGTKEEIRTISRIKSQYKGLIGYRPIAALYRAAENGDIYCLFDESTLTSYVWLQHLVRKNFLRIREVAKDNKCEIPNVFSMFFKIAVDEATEKDCRYIDVEVGTHNTRAILVYLKEGMQIVEKVGKKNYDVYVMRKEIGCNLFI